MSTKDISSYALLAEQDEDHEGDLEISRASLMWKHRFFWLLGFTIVVLLSCVAAVIVVNSQLEACFSAPGHVKHAYSPAQDAITHIKRYLVSDPDTPKFMGKPRPEMDQAWHNLLEGTLIRVSGSELYQANNATSVAYEEGGYTAGLGVSHSLHCLKRLKQYLHPDYYYNHEAQDWEELESHADHCLESLRQIVLCQADWSLYTLEWTPHSRVKPTVRVPQAHTCVDWAKLHGWMKDRAARLDRMVPPSPELFDD